jgi:predicted nucleic acid-binding protein
MAAYFTDTSATVKRYIDETGSPWVRSLFADYPPNTFVAVSIVRIEVASAIARRARGGTISVADANVFTDLFLIDLGSDFILLPVSEILLNQAVRLTRLYGPVATMPFS